jgi:hypothetical protein
MIGGGVMMFSLEGNGVLVFLKLHLYQEILLLVEKGDLDLGRDFVPVALSEVGLNHTYQLLLIHDDGISHTTFISYMSVFLGDLALLVPVSHRRRERV